MSPSDHPSAVYRPALAWFAALGSAWVFVLVILGAFTTTIGAGMAFPDWPLSNGSLNPHGWLSNLAMFAEHSHRLSAGTMGLITLALSIWLWRTETRRWLINLGWSALFIVLLQGLLGGMRVKLNDWYGLGPDMSVGQLLRIPHGILAQIYVIVLFAIAAALSRTWIKAPISQLATSSSLRRWGVACTALLLVQLTVAATMRHFSAGLAIPTFPLTPEGTVIPSEWTFRIAIHFAHRALALILTLALIGYAATVWRERGLSPLIKNLAAVMVGLLMVQITLGIAVIWTYRDPYFTTAHVLVGACTLAVTFLLTFFAHRNQIDAMAIDSHAMDFTSASKRVGPTIVSNQARSTTSLS